MKQRLALVNVPLPSKKKLATGGVFGIALNTIGQLHKQLAHGDQALEHFLPALDFAKETSNQKLTRDIYSGLADTYENAKQLCKSSCCPSQLQSCSRFPV